MLRTKYADSLSSYVFAIYMVFCFVNFIIQPLNQILFSLVKILVKSFS